MSRDEDKPLPPRFHPILVPVRPRTEAEQNKPLLGFVTYGSQWPQTVIHYVDCRTDKQGGAKRDTIFKVLPDVKPTSYTGGIADVANDTQDSKEGEEKK